jgi:hypothetical protein
MKKQAFVLAAAVVSGLAMVASGCFGSDPNGNSMLLNPDAGSGNGGTTTVNPNGPIIGTVLATFDSTVDGFVLNNFHETSAAQTNLGDLNSGLAVASMTVDSAVGNPTPASLAVMAPFSGKNQYIDVQNAMKYGITNPVNWAGGIMHVRVKADGGIFSGVAQPYVTTTSGYVFGGNAVNFLKNNDWQEFVLNVSSPPNPTTPNAGYDPTKVVIFGLQMNSGSSGSAQGPVTFHIDSFSIENVTAPAPGSDAAAGNDAATGSDAAAID